MGMLESLKEKVEKITGWRRPSPADLRSVVRRRKPNALRFEDDGVIPNNPKLPFILYRSPVSLAYDLIRRRYLKSCSHAMAGVIRGETAFTITCTTTRGRTRCLASRAAMQRFASVANVENNSASWPATLQYCRPEQATSGLRAAKICWWSARIRLPAAMTSAERPPRSTIAP